MVTDASGANLYQQQGTWCCHPSRVEQAQRWMNDGGVASADALIQLGKPALTRHVNSALPKVTDNQNLNSNTQYPPADANKIAEQCNQIREFRDKKGVGQNEPLWRDCIGVVGYCENGEALCQDWSSGHSGYSEAKTSQKLVYRLKFPPTTCAQFKKSNPSGCQGCMQKCNSPITLGWKDGFEIQKSVSGGEPIGLLEIIQQQYCLININGKVWVLDRLILNNHFNQGPASKLSLSNRGDGTLFLMRMVKLLSPQADAAKIAKEFFINPRTICYYFVEFNPAGTSEKALNLWVGPTITPKSGEWRLIAAYLLNVICDGDQKSYAYLVSFIAHALQKPEEKPGILIILLGGQGTGKGTLARILQQIWSATFLQIHNIDSVTGNFNAALERNFIVFMDEALFVGDRRASDALKSLVTEPVIHINEKHQPARQMQSFHRFFAATNADHFKNTERDDRRDFVLRVSEAHKGDHTYWKALYSEIDNGGVEAMVHDLLTMDISDFNVRNKSSTQALIDQKLQSLDPIPRWWHDCLINGGFDEDGKWLDFISTSDIIGNVIEFTGRKIFRNPTSIDVNKAMIKLCPSAQKKQLQEQYLKKRGFTLPSLEQARREFEAYIGGTINWQ